MWCAEMATLCERTPSVSQDKEGSVCLSKGGRPYSLLYRSDMVSLPASSTLCPTPPKGSIEGQSFSLSFFSEAPRKLLLCEAKMVLRSAPTNFDSFCPILFDVVSTDFYRAKRKKCLIKIFSRWEKKCVRDVFSFAIYVSFMRNRKRTFFADISPKFFFSKTASL